MRRIDMRTNRTRARWCAAILIALAGCTSSDDEETAMPGDSVTPAAQSEWKPLFDGATTAGWRGYGQDTMPAGWQVVDSALTRVAEGGDIVTTEQYGNFELELEWKIRPGGNSGIFYRGVEITTGPIYHTAPEYQVLDNAAHADGAIELTSAGSNYALHPAPRDLPKPPGEWNATRIVVNGNHVEHWLNGTKVVDYELGSDDWKARVAASKFKEWPDYGLATRGYIGLQDHGDWVAYRNIRIKVLP
jgi:hypothetical protein